MARRPCSHPGCGGYAAYRGRCPEHVKEYERDLDTRRAGRRVYNSKRWKLLRRRKLFENPLCERCGAIAEHVHHKEGVNVVTWELEALESLCPKCHGQETRHEQLNGSAA